MTVDSRPDEAAALAALTAKHGNAERALAKLWDENHEYRTKNRELREKLTAAEAAKPGDGAVVLTGADAKEYEALKALGSAKDVTTKLAAADAASTKLATLEREKVEGEGAALAGYKASVLSRLAKSEGFAVEVRDEPADGKPARVPYARPVGDDKAPWVKLTDYAAQHLGDFLPALTASASGTGTTTQGSTATGGPKYPPQAGGSTAPKADVYSQIREQVKAEREKATQDAHPIQQRLGVLAS